MLESDLTTILNYHVPEAAQYSLLFLFVTKTPQMVDCCLDNRFQDSTPAGVLCLAATGASNFSMRETHEERLSLNRISM